MIIETERLIIRELTIEDVDDLFEYCSNPVMEPFITFPLHQTISWCCPPTLRFGFQKTPF